MRILFLLTAIILSIPAMAGEFGFFQVSVRDQAASQLFYKKVLGWEFTSSNVRNFTLVTNAGVTGGLLTVEQAAPKSGGVKLFFTVSNLRETLQEVDKAGGKVTAAPANVAAEIWVAEFEDLDGNLMGLHCGRGLNCILPR